MGRRDDLLPQGNEGLARLPPESRGGHQGLEEGIAWAEGMDPREALEDEHGHLRAVRFQKYAFADVKWTDSGEQPEVMLRSLFIAAGTSPNTIYQTEYPDTFEMD